MSMRARNRLVGQLAWVSAGRLGAALLQAVTLVVTARAVAPSEFGLLAGVLGLATLVQTFSDCGMASFVSRERAADSDSGSIRSALRFNSLTSLLLLGLLSAGLVVASLALDPIYALMIPLALWASGERNADTRLVVVFADGDVWINVSNLVMRRLLALAIVLALTSADVEPVLSYCVGVAVGATLSSVAARLIVQPRLPPEDTMTVREVLREARPYWVHSVATQARNLDTMLVAMIASPLQAGFYSSASRLTNPLLLIPSSLASLVLPTASRAVSTGSSLRPVLKAIVIVVGGMSTAYAIIFVLAPTLIPAVLGDAYTSSVPVLRIVLVGLPFAAWTSLFASLLQGRGDKTFVARTSLAMIVVSLSLVCLGAFLGGARGASGGLSVALAIHSVLLTVVFLSVRRKKKENWEPASVSIRAQRD